jgi:hypothetical protein
MSFDIAKLDDHIERLRVGDTLTENEVKALCEKVRISLHGLQNPKTVAVVHGTTHCSDGECAAAADFTRYLGSLFSLDTSAFQK